MLASRPNSRSISIERPRARASPGATAASVSSVAISPLKRKTKPILASENPTRRRHGLRLVIEQPPQSRQSATRLDDATITGENALQDLWIARQGRIDRFLPAGIGHEYRLADRPALCIDRPNSDHGSSQTDRGHILAVCVGDCEHVADRAGGARPHLIHRALRPAGSRMRNLASCRHRRNSRPSSSKRALSP